jgi:DNA-directed RNA polymerase specialized sigma24 family protein
MEKELVDKDRKIAQAICDDIKNGDNTSLNRWFTEYYQELVNLVRYRIFDKRWNKNMIEENPEEILHKFYIELSSGNAFCQYIGKNNCSLKSYIAGRLGYRCRKSKTNSVDQSKLDNTDSPNEAEPEIEKIPDTSVSVENLLIEEQRRYFLYQALDRLACDERTVEDAKLLSWFLHGIPYDEMAKRSLMGKNMATTDDEIKRESTRIRKRMTRPGGSMEKLGDILKQMMENS